MTLKHALIVLLILAVASAAYAQKDDCPPGGTKHAALTGTDHASMEAAVVASFRGLYHRDPSGAPGSGPDDVSYWISTFDHFGPYGDGICRAGWNAYAETRLSGAESGDPRLGDQPARFQPSTVPVPPSVAPAPVVTPAPPVISDDAVLAAIADLKATMQAEHAEQTRTVGDALKSFGEFAVKYVAPAIGAYLAGHQMAK